ncbi:PREDICTED: cationic amino acid transporter 1-like [Nelumbo nucifera]|uniref:Cationic amino acid transporter 1-like n=1 Tax=Nelumbo nucifera TaxID=4432 RepID=A0A1U8BIM8_NELNU|nr:PREDICTED: cationic amino acid transporter 1-like [Nelumbo nucifera]
MAMATTGGSGGATDGGTGSTATKRRGCWCSKDDFFPEESFRNWGSYVKALGETKARLKDRLFARSLDDIELNQVRARSQHEMKKSLSWWDLIWFGVSSVMGAGIFVLTGLEARNDAGPAVVISFVVSGISALLSVFCYTEFAVDIPVAGGSFAYLRVELGDFAAYIAAGNILFEYIVAGAGVARSWTSYFATLCNHEPDDFRIVVSGLNKNYNHLDPISVVISAIVAVLASVSTKGSSVFNVVASVIHIAVLLLIVCVGLTKANVANFSNFAPYGVKGVFKASAVLFFAYVGFDGVATLGEETKKPARDIPIGLVGSMLITIVFYCFLGATLCLMLPFTAIDVNAPYSEAFQAVGMRWVKYIVALGALKGMTTVLLTNIIGQARYFTHIGRTHMAPPWLAIINKKFRTPMNATIVMTIANSIVGFFTDLSILSNLLSISTLFIFSLVAVALLVRRYYVAGVTSNHDRNMFVGFLTLILVSSIATAVYWAATTIAVNMFLLGSLDVPSFVRFVVWTLILIIYYLLVGLHASYDVAKEGLGEAHGVDLKNIGAPATHSDKNEVSLVG